MAIKGLNMGTCGNVDHSLGKLEQARSVDSMKGKIMLILANRDDFLARIIQRPYRSNPAIRGNDYRLSDESIS
jgi:hypothetical protein